MSVAAATTDARSFGGSKSKIRSAENTAVDDDNDDVAEGRIKQIP
jgi:hypothetical protein